MKEAASVKSARDNLGHLHKNLEKVLVGKSERLRLVLLAVAAGGHVLLEDMPGVGKTTLARALARSIDGRFSRLQFTPDLLPTDITGVNIYRPQDGSFQFREGPVFANVLLADEINRASPRTQSALLEAMSEERVTLDGAAHVLPQPFIVLATQNPVEYHGTYPLPEAQLDRFMVLLDLGYPPEEEEKKLILDRTRQDPVDSISPVLSLEELEEVRQAVDGVRMEDSVAGYLLAIVRQTRHHPRLQLGVSPRGGLLYARLARARALSEGRDFVIPEDVQTLAAPALAHRVLLESKARYTGLDRTLVIEELVKEVPLPR